MDNTQDKSFLDTLSDLKNVVGKDGVQVSVSVRLLPETYLYLLGVGFLLWGLATIVNHVTNK